MHENKHCFALSFYCVLELYKEETVLQEEYETQIKNLTENHKNNYNVNGGCISKELASSYNVEQHVSVLHELTDNVKDVFEKMESMTAPS